MSSQWFYFVTDLFSSYSDSEQAFAERKQEMMTIRRRSESVLEYKEQAHCRLQEELLRAQQVGSNVWRHSYESVLTDSNIAWAPVTFKMWKAI